jgi:hypothetical protein
MTGTRSDLRRPRALRAGDRVAVLTASSPANADRLLVGLDALRFAGLDPVVYASAREPGTVRHYLAGTEALRAADLRSALLDESIAGILVASGGYGAQRTLEAMDWTGIDAVAPKVVVGYSDVTAVLEAMATKLGWTSLMGPMVSESEFAEAYSFSSLLRCLMAPARVGPCTSTTPSPSSEDPVATCRSSRRPSPPTRRGGPTTPSSCSRTSRRTTDASTACLRSYVAAATSTTPSPSSG